MLFQVIKKQILKNTKRLVFKMIIILNKIYSQKVN